MGKVVKVLSTRCCGLTKDDFLEVYCSMFPYKSDRDFDVAWEQYEEDKARHIRQLNESTGATP